MPGDLIEVCLRMFDVRHGMVITLDFFGDTTSGHISWQWQSQGSSTVSLAGQRINKVKAFYVCTYILDILGNHVLNWPSLKTFLVFP